MSQRQTDATIGARTLEHILSRNRASAGVVALALFTGLSTVGVSAAQAAAPTCFGKRATIVGTGGSDTLKGTARADVIVGKGGQDLILGKGGSDLICGGGGPDLIRGDGGNDKLNGGAGQDKIYYNTAPTGVTVNLTTGRSSGGSGNDVLKGFEDIVGSNSADVIIGSNGQNLISSLNGDDSISSGGGMDILEGGAGDDTLDGGRSADGTPEINIVWYESSFATLGPTGPVTVDLGAGTATDPDGTDTLSNLNTVVGSKYADQITGDNGDNFLLGGANDDTINGAGGFDVVIYWFAPGSVTVNLQSGTSSGGDGNDTLAEIEGIYGSNDFGDTLIGNDRDNFLDGSGGADTMKGAAGSDWIMGGDGRDQIDGGTHTGRGYDLVDYEAHFGGPVSANLETGIVTGLGNDNVASDDTLIGIEGLYGSLFDDILSGDAGPNNIFGWIGNDRILGGAGDDGLDGGLGYFDVDFNFHQTGDSDSLNGGDGNDSCSFAETSTACESTAAPPSHPLSAEAQAAQAVQALRRAR